LSKMNPGSSGPMSDLSEANPKSIEYPTQLVDLEDLSCSVHLPIKKYHVLFLHGGATNALTAQTLLQHTGWMGKLSDIFEFVIPDAPNVCPDVNQEFAELLNLKFVTNESVHSTGTRMWGAIEFVGTEEGPEFIVNFNRTHSTVTDSTAGLKDLHKNGLKKSLDYLVQIIRKYGPFDGVVGFSEGATIATVMLHLQAACNSDPLMGRDFGLKEVNFFINMSGWRVPIFEELGFCFNCENPLPISSLHISGKQEPQFIRESVLIMSKDYKDSKFFEHKGGHIYPHLTSNLEALVRELLTC